MNYSVINIIKYGDNERSRLNGIGSCGELVFKDVSRDSTISCVGSENMTSDSE